MRNDKIDIKNTVNRVKAHCTLLGVRLTPSRRQVLELVLAYPDIIKAYDVLSDLQRERGHAAPPTVYRALDFLVEIGVLHRAESLNGFIFCPHFDEQHSSVILSCSSCGKTEELHAADTVATLSAFCHAKGFAVAQGPLVLSGLCAKCQQAEDNGL